MCGEKLFVQLQRVREKEGRRDGVMDHKRKESGLYLGDMGSWLGNNAMEGGLVSRSSLQSGTLISSL